jgi:hypothetical protein
MQKLFSLFLIVILIAPVSIQQTYAQNAALTTTNLPAEYKTIIENVKKECNLNADQTKKFTVDYVDFVNKAKANDVTNANNEQKRKDETLRLLYGVSLKLKTYLNTDQQTKLAKMIQDGKLTPKPETTATSKTDMPANSNGMPTAVTPDYVTNANVIKPQSDVTGLFEQLQGYLKVSAEQAKKVTPILKDYDKKAVVIKTVNANNPQKQKQETDKLNADAAAKLKEIITVDQLNTFALAISMQENILSGKNISPQQKKLIDNARRQYSLNDAQTMAVIIVMVQAKLRGDVIAVVSKTNPDQAKQESIALVQELNSQLMAVLDADQYEKVKNDIERMMEKK